MLTPGTILQDRYTIMGPFGRGGMGAVYAAADRRLGHTVALKETFHGGDGRLAAAFEREARLLARLQHPALPGVSDYFSEGGGRYLVMEYIPGEDFGQRLTRRGRPFPADEVMGWADQLLDALDYLHRQDPPVIHHDIKPANLKVTDWGQLTLLDFGLAMSTGEGVPAGKRGGSVLGFSLRYAPPEQLDDSGTGPRSDLYSASATLYHLLTGAPPADALTRVEALSSGRPDPLRLVHDLTPGVSPLVATVLHRAMAIPRKERPVAAAEMRGALREAARSSTPTANERKPRERIRTWVGADAVTIRHPRFNAPARSGVTCRVAI